MNKRCRCLSCAETRVGAHEWRCSGCGKVDVWRHGWSYYGCVSCRRCKSEPGIEYVACSDACADKRAGADEGG